MIARQRILVIGPSNIGDAILISEVIRRLAARYPEAHLTLAVGTRATAVFADDPRIHTLVDAGAYDQGIGRAKLAWAFWRYQPTILVDLRHTVFPLLLAPLRAWRYLLPPPKRLTHMRDRHLWRLARQVPGLTPRHAPRQPEPEGCALWRSPRDQAHVDQLWARWRLSGRPLVVICPGARSHIKRWTADGFAEVADRLADAEGAEILFSGEADEKPVIDEILGLMRAQARSAAGLLTIRQLALVLERAALVITNDSASLHLASSVGVPTLAIFGPTDEAQYGPTAPRARVVRRRLICTPCKQSLCRYQHECMRFIGAGEVCAAAQALLGEQGA